ncbi:cyclic nucleotide-binding-like protein [Baffinella frigidus]|nr:cyclic nucleotide-binding-like protein [Cryptophyta sp. CCMP2293]
MADAADAGKAALAKVASGKSEQVKAYLEATVVPVLTQGLTQLCVAEPEDPFTWLAQWLIENHPTKPANAVWADALVLKLKVADFFGEIALLSGKPRQATVKAVGAVTVLVMSRDAFTRLCGPLFEILRRNMATYTTMELPEEAVPQGGVEEEVAVEETEEADEGEEESEAPARPQRGRRNNVFVESAKVEDDWVPPTSEKTEDERGRLEAYISKTALLSFLDSKARATVVSAFEKKTYSKDDDIIKQGEDGDYYYILDSGHTEVWLSKPPGTPEVKVFEYSVGGAFGELALLHGEPRQSPSPPTSPSKLGEPRQATVRATQDCVTWALDRDTFRKIMMSTGKSEMNQRIEFISKVELLAEMSLNERFRLAELAPAETWSESAASVCYLLT